MNRGHIADRVLQRKLMPVVAIFIGIISIALALTFLALEVQSAMRGYVAAEGQWSKAQRDAALLLQLYGRTGEAEYWRRFEQTLVVPMGNQRARFELQKRRFDYGAAHQGFLDGGTHPDDIPGMIRLFRCCANVAHMARAFDYWAQGDLYLQDLARLGNDLHEEIASEAAPAERIDELLRQIQLVNEQVQPLEAAFTATLGDAARLVKSLLFIATAGVIMVLILLAAYLSWRILRRIRQSEDQYRVLLDTASDALVVIDRSSGTVLNVNARARKITGRSDEELIGSRYLSFFPNLPATLIATGEQAPAIVRTTVVDAEGAGTAVEVSCSATRWGDRAVVLAILRDISERVRSERELMLAASAMVNMVEGVIITDARQRIVSVNRAFIVTTGYTKAEAVGRAPRYLLSRRSDRSRLAEMWHAVRALGRWQGEIWGRRKNGQFFPAHVSVSAVRGKSGRINHYVAVFNDISTSKNYEQRLRQLADHDALTGLLNRTRFSLDCTRILDNAAQRRRQAALLFIDLDGFKRINDTHGHGAGDHLLKVVGERLRRCVRAADPVARMGGDEFAILLEDVADENAATRITWKVLRALGEPVEWAAHKLDVAASIGISLFPRDADNLQTLMTQADTAMYEAKSRRRNNYLVFSNEIAQRALSRFKLTGSLKLATEREQMRLEYQPLVELATGKVTSLEVLLRWRHPEMGNVPPATFIPLAEEAGLITQITEWVLTRACQEAQTWSHGDLESVPIAVNLSARSFSDRRLASKVGRILRETGWDPKRLWLEITETTILDQDHAEDILGDLSDLGIRVAIDDFGIGYSSLSYLKRFPVHALKIDRFFTSSLPADPGNAGIARAIIALARTFDLKVTAEGVETDAQRRFFLDEGCDEGQGYLFGRPMSSQMVGPLLAAGNTWIH